MTVAPAAVPASRASDQTPAETPIAVAAETPPFVQSTPPPGWTSSEFLTTCAVHVLNLLAVLLDLLHVRWGKGLSTMQGLIPITALALSALLQALYQNHRTQLKIAHLEQAAAVKVSQVRAAAQAVEPSILPALQAAEGLITDPDVKQRLGSIETAVSRLKATVQSSTPVAPPVTTNIVVQAPVGDPTTVVGDPTEASGACTDPTVPIAVQPPTQDGATGADPTLSSFDPTGGLYLDPNSDEARTELASG